VSFSTDCDFTARSIESKVNASILSGGQERSLLSDNEWQYVLRNVSDATSGLGSLV